MEPGGLSGLSEPSRSRMRALLTCRLCTRYLTEPRMLPCRHSFCLTCLQHHHDSFQHPPAAGTTTSTPSGTPAAGTGVPRRVGSMPCPTCHQPIGVPLNGVRGFPVDTRIDRLKDLVVNELASSLSSKLGASGGREGSTTQSERGSREGRGSTHSERGGEWDRESTRFEQEGRDWGSEEDRYSTRSADDGDAQHRRGRSYDCAYGGGVGYQRNPAYPDFSKFARFFDRDGRPSSAEAPQFRPTIKPERRRVAYSASLQHQRRRRVNVQRLRAYDDSEELLGGRCGSAPPADWEGGGAGREQRRSGEAGGAEGVSYRSSSARDSAHRSRYSSSSPEKRYSPQRFHSPDSYSSVERVDEEEGETGFSERGGFSEKGCYSERGGYLERAGNRGSEAMGDHSERMGGARKSPPVGRGSDGERVLRGGMGRSLPRTPDGGAVRPDAERAGGGGGGGHGGGGGSGGAGKEGRVGWWEAAAPRSSSSYETTRRRVTTETESPESRAKKGVQAQVQAQPHIKSHDQPRTQPQPKHMAQQQPQTQPKPQAQHQAQTQPKPHEKFQAQPQASPKIEPQGQTKAQTEAQPQAQPHEQCQRQPRAQIQSGSEMHKNLVQAEGERFQRDEGIKGRGHVEGKIGEDRGRSMETVGRVGGERGRSLGGGWKGEEARRTEARRRFSSRIRDQFEAHLRTNEGGNTSPGPAIPLRGGLADETPRSVGSDRCNAGTPNQKLEIGVKAAGNEVKGEKNGAKIGDVRGSEEGTTEKGGRNWEDLIQRARTKYLRERVPPPERGRGPPVCEQRVQAVWSLSRSDFCTPTSLCLPSSGGVIAAEYGQSRLEFYDDAGTLTHSMEGIKPFCVTLNQADQVVVGDRRSRAVRIFDEWGGDVAHWDLTCFSWLCGLAALRGGVQLAVLDRERCRVGVYAPPGERIREFSSFGCADAQLCMADFLALDSRGRLLVADSGNHCVKVFDPSSGAFLTKFGSRGVADGCLDWPKGICVDASDNVIVTDLSNKRVSVFGPDGRFVRHLLTGVENPWGVCYSAQRRCMGLTQFCLDGTSQYSLYTI